MIDKITPYSEDQIDADTPIPKGYQRGYNSQTGRFFLQQLESGDIGNNDPINDPKLLGECLEGLRKRMDSLINQFGERERRTDDQLQIMAEQSARNAINERAANLRAFLSRAGVRYEKATLDSFEAASPNQKSALERIRVYLKDAKENIRGGVGLLLFGPTGTGKDHLLVGLAREIIPQGCKIAWGNGVALYAALRATMGDHTSETEEQVVERYTSPRVLLLSDPLPPTGVLTDYQAATLYRIIDERYRNMMPIWCSLNVAGIKEAIERLGAATTDRLRDGAIAIECNWPSHRKARG